MTAFTTVQMRVAEATASIDAATLMIHRDLKETADVVMSGGTVDVDMRMRNRLTHSFAVKLLTNAVDALFNAAGGSALGMHHPLQRFWRELPDRCKYNHILQRFEAEYENWDCSQQGLVGIRAQDILLVSQNSLADKKKRR